MFTGHHQSRAMRFGGENRKSLWAFFTIHRCRLAELRTVFNSQEIAWDVFRILEHQADKCRLKRNEQGLKYREI